VTVLWTSELVSRDDGGPELVRASKRWRIRVVSDRYASRLLPDGSAERVASRSEDFLVILDEEFGLWIRHPEEDSFRAHARGGGVAFEMVANVTKGIEHLISIRRKPSDDLRARWSCSCGAHGRGDAAPDITAAAAEAHASVAKEHDEATVARGGMSREVVVAQDEDGQWSRRSVTIVRRFRVCVRSDRSVVKAHQRGHGEEFELAVDGQLGLWSRCLGSDAALRTDQDARGVSLILLDVV
jgi:hypothetical protein